MFEFRLPDVGEGVTEGEIIAWEVAPGDEVEEDEVLAEVETDKAVVDLPSPVAGTVDRLHAEPGEVVPVGDVVITIDPHDPADGNVDEVAVEAGLAEGGADPAAEGTEADSGSGRVFAAPSVRRLARERGVDLAAVDGSGPGGRVTATDVETAAGTGGAADDEIADAITDVASAAAGAVEEPAGAGAGGGSGPQSAIRRVDDEPAAASRDRTLATPATRRLATELGVDLDAVPTEKTRNGEAFAAETDVSAYAEAQEAAQAADEAALAAAADTGQAAERDAVFEPEGETREPYRGVRRTIGEQMAESAFTIPHVTHHDMAAVPALAEARAAMKPRAEERGVTLTYVPFVLKAVVAALREYPALNTSLDEENSEVVYKHRYDIGVATATDAGLMVPVVEAVDQKSLLTLAAEVRELTQKARDRSIEREEMRGGTFTITNFGAIGGEYATPLINHPETAILGLGAIERRPAVVDGAVEAVHTLPLSLSIDHRVIDGAEAANFVNTVTEYLRTPSLLLLE